MGRTGSTIGAEEILTVWHVLEQGRASGLLWIRHEGSDACVTFRAGFAVGARGNGSRIGDALVRHGVPEDTVQNAIKLQKRLRIPQPIGTLLVGFGRVGTTTLQEILRTQCREIIDACRGACKGTLEFEALDEETVPVGLDGGVTFADITEPVPARG